MKYVINFFGYHLETWLFFDDGKLAIKVSEENQRALKDYLIRVLPKYGRELDNHTSFKELVMYAITVEKQINGHMSEPRIKLPYEFQPEIKEMLIEAAELQGLSATQLLIRLIEKKYQSVMSEGDVNNGLRKQG
ncbi:MAG: hypothetical protein ACOY35_11415 [Bacillota bacterium]